MMNKMKKRVFRMICSTLIVMIIAGITMTVQGMEKPGSGYDENCYDRYERDYLDEVSGALAELGLKDSGVNLTKKTNAQGEREYKLVIYLDHFSNECVRDEVSSLITDIKFGDENCRICVNTCEG